MDQRIINLFDEYTHKPLARQDFIKRLAKLAGGMATALTILPLLEADYTSAAVIPENDETIVTEDITYEGDNATIKAYLARPKTKESKKSGAVIVIHENRGLTPHIRDVARRIAKAGYIALAPDALSVNGGTPTNEDEARKLIGELDLQKNLNNYLKGLAYLRTRSDSNKKTGAIGFCWGGKLANQLAVHDAELSTAIAFYGKQPEAADAKKIKAKIQLHYAGLDERINAGISAYEEALKLAGVKYELYLYEGVQHAFHNDTTPARYNEAAAKLAWNRTLHVLNETLT